MFNSIRTLFTATAAATAILTAGAVAAQAGQQNFSVVNASGDAIYYVFVSPDTSDNWGDDVLGNDILPDGMYAEIQMDNYGSHCAFDIMVANAYGDTLEFWGVDLCSVSEVVVE